MINCIVRFLSFCHAILFNGRPRPTLGGLLGDGPSIAFSILIFFAHNISSCPHM
jgi:hypothetical protein